MGFNEVITLVAEVKTVDDYGDISATETTRDVFAKLSSITQSEFYQAEAVGLKPEIKFILADYLDYENEELVRYKAFNETETKTYTVLRTYRNGNALELVCKRGIN